MTIQEIQAAIDAKYDVRQIINMIADYLEDNPSGGASGIDDVLAIGQALTNDREIDLAGHEFTMKDGVNACTYEFTPVYLLLENNDGRRFQIDNDTDTIRMRWDGDNEHSITSGGHQFTGPMSNTQLAALDFADDAAAAAGGVAVNQWYHTSGTLKIRLS